MAEPRMSTEEEIEALDALCQRMAGFEDQVSLEWLDGYMAALLAGPRRVAADEWLPVFAEGVFARAFVFFPVLRVFLVLCVLSSTQTACCANTQQRAAFSSRAGSCFSTFSVEAHERSTWPLMFPQTQRSFQAFVFCRTK